MSHKFFVTFLSYSIYIFDDAFAYDIDSNILFLIIF